MVASTWVIPGLITCGSALDAFAAERTALAIRHQQDKEAAIIINDRTTTG